MKTHDNNVEGFWPVITPLEIRQQIPMSPASIETVIKGRNNVRRILLGEDERKFLIVGPCSIHDPDSAIEYSKKLLELAKEVEEKICIIMRTYFEKPRTHTGWKGFVNDPFLDSTFKMNEGLTLGRKLLCDITDSGMPVANEALDPILPQYLSELISWTAIGARTTESQLHREMASGLSAPVGFKNNTDGNVMVAVNAMRSAAHPHHFLGIDEHGKNVIVGTKGNGYCHIILRGGSDGPNYDSKNVSEVEKVLTENKLPVNIVIDCGHDNSSKDYRNQPKVLADCLRQIKNGNKSIRGFMLESHLSEGKQPLSQNLKYGVSITDGCISFEETQRIVREAKKSL